MSDPYHDHPAISRSKLSEFLDSRRTYESRYVIGSEGDKEDRDKLTAKAETASMSLGTNVHGVLLEPDEYQRRIRIVPPSALTKSGSLVRNSDRFLDWLDEQDDGTIALKKSEADRVEAIRDAVLAEPSLRKIIESSLVVREEPRFWTQDIDSETSIECRCKPDLLIDRGDSIQVWDIKTTNDSSERAFRSSIYKFRYWLQDAHYSAGVFPDSVCGIDHVEFFFAAVQTSGLHPVRVYELTPADRFEASRLWMDALTDLADCHQSGDWSDAGEGEITMLELNLGGTR